MNAPKTLSNLTQEIPPPQKKYPTIRIAGAPIHIPRKNPANFDDYLMDSLGVTDKGPRYNVCVKKI